MPAQLAGFPFWILEFDSGARPAPGVQTFLDEMSSAGLTDLFVFSHGWNNNHEAAMLLYNGFFGEVRNLLDDPSTNKRADRKVGVAGVIWPSILFPGDSVPTEDEGGAASFTPDLNTPTLESELPKVFTAPEQLPVLQDLLKMVDERPPDNDALLAFRDKLKQLVSSQETIAAQDDLELRAATVENDDDWFALLDLMSVQAVPNSNGGAASLGGVFGKLWNGAVSVLRTATYWQMKDRAGLIGKQGLGPLLGQLHSAAPSLRIHLLGHSFGARLVSYALAGLPERLTGPASPVKTLFLLQGAFSHFAFAEALPFDSSRAGDLAGMDARVDGPLLTTFSLKDLAVGNAYPAASILFKQDAAASIDLLYRWEGMGRDGAQAVDAAEDVLGDVQTVYNFQPGKWINLDGNRIIVLGDPPSGAHGDIIHPETAWAALTAAKIAIPNEAERGAVNAAGQS